MTSPPTPETRRLLVRAAFWVCVAGVLTLSVLPPSAPMPTLGWDKANHMLAFFVLGLLASAGWKVRTALLGLPLLAGLIEVIQALLPYRSASTLDLVADAAGLALAIAAWRAAAFFQSGTQAG